MKIRKKLHRRFGVPRRVSRLKLRLEQKWYSLKQWQRVLCASLAGVMFLAAVIPTAQFIIVSRSYILNDQVRQLVGEPNKNLANKITYNSEKKSWQFNQGDIPIGTGNGTSGLQQADMPSANDLKAQVGGGGEKDKSLYAVDMPSKGADGVTYYDTNTDLSFSLVPKFSVGEGRNVDGHLVYPSEHGSKLVYTAKTNGMKEDIVLTKSIGDDVEFSYKLKLPDTLEAKIQDDGSLGVYSPNPVLFGNISFGGDQDKEKLLSARKTAAKDHLLFVLPAPVIVEAGGKKAAAHAKFSLSDGVLTVKATDLADLHYPVSVDPSVVVTSSADFANGNSDNINYGTDQISRTAVTGGTISSWSAGTDLPAGRTRAAGAAYAGYAYIVGGYDPSAGPVSTIGYAPINSDGSLGSWSATTSLPTALLNHRLIAFNGYLYALGGYAGSTTRSAVYYAPINSNGTVGSWTTTSSMNTARKLFASASYQGRVYVWGGDVGNASDGDTGNYTATVEYASFKPDGSLSTWTSATSMAAGSACGSGDIYNGYIYYYDSSCGGGRRYARLADDGTIGSWTTITNTTGICDECRMITMGGYVYMVAGWANADNGGVNFAMINASGTLTDFATTTAIGVASGTKYYDMVVFSYGNRIYTVGGNDQGNCAGGSGARCVRYSNLDSTGVNAAYTAGNTFTTNRRGAMTVVYNNYIYVMGGDAGSTPVNTVRRAPLNADGSIGSWSTDTNLAAAVTYGAAVAYRGYMYVIGGCTSAYASCTTAGNNVTNVRRSAISLSDGSLGAWSTDTSITTARYGASIAAYGNYLYIMGGLNGSTFQNDIQYHSIGSSGAISGSWTTSSYTISTARAYAGTAVDGGKLYIAGGCSAGATSCSTAQSDIQYGTFGSSGELTGALTTNSTSFTNARGMHGFMIDDGYAYVAGGLNNGTYYNDTQFAPMNSNGSIGSWSTGRTFTNARAGAGYGIANGFIYVAGGHNGGTYYNTTYYARLHSGGSGSVGTWGSTGVSFSLQSYSSVYSNGYLYVFGGRTGATPLAETYYAPIDANGNIGSAVQTTSMNTGRSYSSAYVSGGYMYVAGGKGTSGTQLNSVEYAPINGNGSLGAWSTATATLATARGSAAGVSYNGYIYYIGGYDGSAVQSGVYYANVANGGDFSSWSPTTSLPSGVSGAGSVVYNGYLYVVGGWDGSDVGRVLYAQINSNGTLGSWNSTTWMQLAGGASVTAANGMLYVTGVYSWSADQGYGYTYRAAIHADGSLGTFRRMADVANPGENKAAFYINGRLYVMGVSSVYVGTPESVARVGRYSKMVDLGGGYGLTSMVYNGTLKNSSLIYLSFRGASDGGTFGSVTSAADLTGLPPTCSNSSTRYVQIYAGLDDTFTSVYPDVNSTMANVTDFTVNYSTARAVTNERLAHGKYFSGEVLQGLDVCGS